MSCCVRHSYYCVGLRQDCANSGFLDLPEHLVFIRSSERRESVYVGGAQCVDVVGSAYVTAIALNTNVEGTEPFRCTAVGDGKADVPRARSTRLTLSQCPRV